MSDSMSDSMDLFDVLALLRDPEGRTLSTLMVSHQFPYPISRYPEMRWSREAVEAWMQR